MAEQKHTHTANCYKIQLLCAKQEHTHGGSIPGFCYDKDGNVKCGIPEHSHSGGSPCHGPVGPICGYV